MDFIKKHTNAIVWAVIELVLGILLLVDGVSDSFNFVKVLVIACGVILLIIGVYSLVKYFITPAAEAEGKFLYGGLTLLTLGLIMLIKHEWFDALTWIVAVIFGLILLFAGFGKVQSLSDKLRLNKKEGWVLDLVSAIVLIALGIVVLVVDNDVIKIILGVLIMVVAVYDMVVLIFLARADSAVKKAAVKAEAQDVEDTEEVKQVEDKKDDGNVTDI